MSLPKLLVISPVANLFPLDMGCKVRILNTLRAAREKFEVTFVSACDSKDIPANQRVLESICSRTILLPRRYRENLLSRVSYWVRCNLAYYLAGVPKMYYSNRANLSPKRVKNALVNSSFDIVLFEYWLSARSVGCFKAKGIPCVLDIHDILWNWQESGQNYNSGSMLGKNHQRFLNWRYRCFEKATWRRFNHIISMNTVENQYLRQELSGNIFFENIGMGVDFKQWPYSWKPAKPARIIFYGSLSGRQNERAALRCANQIMPLVWSKTPDVQLWLVGANPPDSLRALEKKNRVKVTGFIEQVQNVLSQATIILCPLSGKYGFRSRLIESMALGVPIVATSDAVYGMNLENRQGIVINDSDSGAAEEIVKLLTSAKTAKEQSLLARKQVEEKFSFEQTYGKMISFLISSTKHKGKV